MASDGHNSKRTDDASQTIETRGSDALNVRFRSRSMRATTFRRSRCAVVLAASSLLDEQDLQFTSGGGGGFSGREFLGHDGARRQRQARAQPPTRETAGKTRNTLRASYLWTNHDYPGSSAADGLGVCWSTCTTTGGSTDSDRIAPGGTRARGPRLSTFSSSDDGRVCDLLGE